MIVSSTLLVGLTFALRPAHPDVIDRFAEHVAAGPQGPVRYRLYSPPPAAQSAGRSTRKYSLVIWFHGAGEAGQENREHLAWLELVFGDDSRRRSPGAYVLAVQFSPDDSVADPAPQERDFVRLDVAWSDVMRRAAIDPERIYLAGVSQGANRAWQYACRHPGRFAALLAMSTLAAGELPDCDLRGLIVWAFASSYDGQAQVDRLRKRLGAKRANASSCVTVVESASHDCWTAALTSYCAWQWLIDQRRGQPMRTYYQSAVGRYINRRQAAVIGVASTLLAAVTFGQWIVRRLQRRRQLRLGRAGAQAVRKASE